MTFQSILTRHPFEGFISALRQLRSEYEDKRQRKAVYERTWRELSAMSNRDMADIGIYSSDIPRIAAEAAAMHKI
jgi:uncharacterized protein YjiS (DUF1127 family)